MKFLDVGYNSMSKGYKTYDPLATKVRGSLVECPSLSVWKFMLTRALGKNKPVSYQDVTVCDEWLDFQNFAEFYFKDSFRQKGWHLDKDILIKGNREYSPLTCCFVPPEINSLFVSYRGVARRERSDLPTGVSIHSKTGLYRARVNSFVTGKQKVKYFRNVEDAVMMFKEMKKNEILICADIWKDSIDPRLHEALINWEV